MISNQYPTIIYGVVNGQIVRVGQVSINTLGQLILTPDSGAGAQEISVFDPIQNGFRTLTAPNGVLTLSVVGG